MRLYQKHTGILNMPARRFLLRPDLFRIFYFMIPPPAENPTLMNAKHVRIRTPLSTGYYQLFH